MTLARILVIDDEPQIQRFLAPALNAAGYETLTALTAREGRALALGRAPDLIIVDLGLPDADGKALIADLRGFTQTPVIVLSAREKESEKVDALDAGADDYIEKPFGMSELLARIRTALRRRGAGTPAETISLGAVEIDVPAHAVRRAGEPVHLTPKEFELFVLLARHAGQVMTHRQLLGAVWGPAHLDDVAYLRVTIRQLRDKLDSPGRPSIISNEPAVGYRVRLPEEG